MPRPMMFFVSVILFMPLATVLVTAQTSLAEPAADECKTNPGPSARPGSHWYYRVNRTDQRHCWFLGPEGAKVRLQAREEPSRVSSPTQTARRENAFGTARVIPAPMEPAQRTPPKPHLANHTERRQILPRPRPISQKARIWTRGSRRQSAITIRRRMRGRTRRRKCH